MLYGSCVRETLGSAEVFWDWVTRSCTPHMAATLYSRASEPGQPP